MEFKDRIRQARLLKHMTLDQVGDEAGISRQSVIAWEDGSSKPQNIRALPLLRAARFLGVNLEWLLEGVGPREAGDEEPRPEIDRGRLMVALEKADKEMAEFGKLDYSEKVDIITKIYSVIRDDGSIDWEAFVSGGIDENKAGSGKDTNKVVRGR